MLKEVVSPEGGCIDIGFGAADLPVFSFRGAGAWDSIDIRRALAGARNRRTATVCGT